jgi:membrane protein
METLRRRTVFAFFGRVIAIVRRLIRAEAMVYAGYLSFLTVLGLVPALAVVYWLAQQSEIARVAEHSLREYLTTHVFPTTASSLVAQITKLRLNARSLGVTALFLLFADVLLKVYALHGAVARISEQRTRWWSPIRLIVVGLVLVPICVAGLVWLLQFFESFFAHLMPRYKSQIDWLFIPLQVSLPLWTALYVFYRWCVPARASSRHVAFIAALVMLGIEAVRLVLTGYFANLAQVRSLYGAFSAMPVLMMSILLSWLLLLAGVAALTERGPRKTARNN